jgi:serine/threonine-protein kinase
MMDLRDQLQASLGAAYTLERELGGGGMSRVFVAREEALAREVVVKVLAPELAAGLSAERFAREIKLAAALQDPHIVPVHTAGVTTEGLPYYTMPFVRGESLRTRLARGPVALGEATVILRDVAAALEYAHERGIVHRDIKPENVLLSGRTAVVTDFGIAKALAASKTQAPDGCRAARGSLPEPYWDHGAPGADGRRASPSRSSVSGGKIHVKRPGADGHGDEQCLALIHGAGDDPRSQFH